MRSRLTDIDSAMVSRLFFRLLPVQVAVVAMGSINSIVDGIVAARFIDADTVGVIGLYHTVVFFLEAAGAVLLGGVSVLSGRYLGSGKIEQTRGVCSLGLAAAFLVGAVLTLGSLLAPRTVALWLGANENLTEALATYIVGYALGIIPQMLAQLLATCLQLERQDRRGQAGIAVMILVNVILDILFVAVWRMGIWGLALSTSVANWAYFLVLAQYYVGGRAQLKPQLRHIPWRELPEMVQIGFPGALLVACLAARTLVLNRILLTYAGQDGLSAMAALNLICALLISFALGAGAVVRMLSSVYVGEENREDLLALTKVVLTRLMVLILGISAAVVLLSPLLSGIFFPDRGSEVYRLSRQLFMIYGCSIPVMQLLLAFSNYCQATSHRAFVNLINLTDGFLSSVIPSMLLAPRLGALGVWLSVPIGLCITAAVSVAYVVIRCKGWPRSAEDWLMLPPDFGTAARLVLELRDLEAVARTAELVQRFCVDHGVSQAQGLCAGVCLEEIAGNIVRHGFHADKRPHAIELRVLPRSGDVLLRIKDDCIPFDPQEWYRMTRPDDPEANIGIRLVIGLADRVEYQNLLGLNVLTIHLARNADFSAATPVR